MPARRIGLIALMLLALAHGMAYALIVPIWQAPDETTLYEYAKLTAELGRVPRAEDHSPALEEALIASMEHQHFWTYTLGIAPPKSLHTLADVQAIFDMPRQVGGDPPAYFVLAALPLSLARAWSIGHQVLLLRMLNVLLLPAIVACAYGAAREVVDDQPAFALAVAGLAALQPMLIFIGASVSNDGPANLLGAALCWAFLRLLRHGFSRRRAALILCLLVLALLTKRSTLPYLALVPGLAWAARATNDERRQGDKETRRQGDKETATTQYGIRNTEYATRNTQHATDNGQRATDNPLTRSPAHPLTRSPGTRRPGAIGRGWSITNSLSSIVYRLSSILRPRWSVIIRRLALPAAALAIVAAWVGQQLDWGGAAGWYDARTGQPATRASIVGRPGAALLVRAGDEVVVPVPAIGTDMLRGQTLRYGAHLWSGSAARGRLIVLAGDQSQEFPFEVSGPLDLTIQAVVPQQAPGLLFGLAADSGSFYADDVWARGERLRGNLITNGAIEMPAVWFESPLSAALGYLRLRDVVWTLQSGRLTQPLVNSEGWVSALFDTFWGYFGWLRVPYVTVSLWRPLLAAGCVFGVLGTLRWLLWRQGHPRQQRQMLVLLLLIVAALAVLVINSYVGPSAYARQQGRYLFPVLVPLACIIALGQSSLLPRRWYRAWLVGWFAFWLTFAGATLAYLVSYYAH